MPEAICLRQSTRGATERREIVRISFSDKDLRGDRCSVELLSRVRCLVAALSCWGACVFSFEIRVELQESRVRKRCSFLPNCNQKPRETKSSLPLKKGRSDFLLACFAKIKRN